MEEWRTRAERAEAQNEQLLAINKQLLELLASRDPAATITPLLEGLAPLLLGYKQAEEQANLQAVMAEIYEPTLPTNGFIPELERDEEWLTPAPPELNPTPGP